MKIGIFSDCHLGERKFRKTYNYQNAYELVNNEVFEEALSILSEKDLDCCIIAGDLYDNPNPYVKTIMESQKLIPFADKLKDKLYILGGNHDWSQTNEAINCHTFDILKNNDMNNKIEIINRESKIFEFYDHDNNNCSKIDFTFLPYKSLNQDNYKNIFKGTLKEKRENNIEKSLLIFHGSVDLMGDMTTNNQENNVFYLPKEIASNYDLVISGHVHIPFLIKTETTSILTPGSLMPSNQGTNRDNRPSVYVYNTENGELINYELKKSPKILEIITDDINNILDNISKEKYNNNLYFIKYNGKSKDIDESIYKLACQKVLNINIQTNENIENFDINYFKNNNLIKDFWKFTEENHPEYIDEFKNILKGE